MRSACNPRTLFYRNFLINLLHAPRQFFASLILGNSRIPRHQVREENCCLSVAEEEREEEREKKRESNRAISRTTKNEFFDTVRLAIDSATRGWNGISPCFSTDTMTFLCYLSFFLLAVGSRSFTFFRLLFFTKLLPSKAPKLCRSLGLAIL